MSSQLLIAAIVLLAGGLSVNLISLQYRTEAGRTTAWYRQWSPVWKQNPYFSPKGQLLTRLASLSMALGAILFLVSLWIGK